MGVVDWLDPAAVPLYSNLTTDQVSNDWLFIEQSCNLEELMYLQDILTQRSLSNCYPQADASERYYTLTVKLIIAVRLKHSCVTEGGGVSTAVGNTLSLVML